MNFKTKFKLDGETFDLETNAERVNGENDMIEFRVHLTNNKQVISFVYINHGTENILLDGNVSTAMFQAIAQFNIDYLNELSAAKEN